jgi:hypothetical protein
MNVPPQFNQNERLLDQFVVAADTGMQIPACDLLFIHGNDLTWGRPEHGFFLAGIAVDERFEEVVQVVEARSQISFIQLIKLLIRQVEPKLTELIKEIAPKLLEVEGDEQAAIATAIASAQVEKSFAHLDKFLPEVLKQWPLFADGIASWLVKGAISLQQRQLSITGMSSDRYESMLKALDNLNVLEHVVRVAYPKGGFHFELSLTSRGEFKTIEAQENAKFVELMRLKPFIAALKRGQDNALAVFIADYINRHFAGPNQAFSCVHYGQQNERELDVVIPALRLGFEVKLSQSPFTQTENKLEKLANDLKKQLPSYIERGCEQIYYVSNLSKGMADSVLRRVQGDGQLKVEVIPIAGGVSGGMEALLPVLKGIGVGLNALMEKGWEQKALAIITAAYESKANTSKSKRSVGKKARSGKKDQKSKAGKAGVRRKVK